MGITATPFANIFIDPDMASDGAAKDLFPRHFLTLLPTPDHYIGADRIFGNGSEDDWTDRVDGEYGDSLIPILNNEQEHFYFFKHKKDLADSLYELPPSMREAIRYFVIATAVSDSRFDVKEHRSMMINVSRFTDVQNVTADMVQEYVNQLSSDIENYHALPIEQAMKINNIARLYETWQKYSIENAAGYSWEHLLKKFLCKAVRRIEVRSVNQKNGAKSLDYYNYKNVGMRVIAVGGNSLSRGLTLEGLTVSYFYRNTMMYDTLLQMGRWFGYRNNYDDLFKIWIGEDAIGWYSYITDAFNELKGELRTMARQNLTPEDFGLKVRQDPGALIVTARNKMRSGTAVIVPITVSGRMIETPRLWRDPEIIASNNELCEEFIRKIEAADNVTREYDENVHSFIWRHVPKKMIVELVSQYKSHPWNLNFQAAALSAFIDEEEDLTYWDVAVPSGSVDEAYELKVNSDEVLEFHGEARKITKDSTVDKMLLVNERHVRVGAGGCSKIGLSPERISALRKQAGGKPTDKTYLVEDRNPVALLHLMFNTNSELQGFPEYIYAIGLGFPGGKEEKKAKYIVNAVDLRNYVDVEDMNDEDDDV